MKTAKTFSLLLALSASLAACAADEPSGGGGGGGGGAFFSNSLHPSVPPQAPSASPAHTTAPIQGRAIHRLLAGPTLARPVFLGRATRPTSLHAARTATALPSSTAIPSRRCSRPTDGQPDGEGPLAHPRPTAGRGFGSIATAGSAPAHSREPRRHPLRRRRPSLAGSIACGTCIHSRPAWCGRPSRWPTTSRTSGRSGCSSAGTPGRGPTTNWAAPRPGHRSPLRTPV